MNTDIRILILEDNPADAEIAEYTLKEAGIKFVSRRVVSEGEYTGALAEFAPDIILSDYNLPGFNGSDALKIARERSPGVPFILFTGAIGEEMAIEVLTGGATDYVMKDRLSRLAPAIRRALKEAEELRKRKEAESARDELLRNAEQVLKAKETELEIVSNATPVMLMRMSRDLRYSYVNRAYASLLGRSSEEIVGRSIVEIIGEEAFGIVRPYIDKTLRGEHVKYDVEIPFPGIGKRYLHIEYSPERNDRGEISGWFATLVDISDRKQMEERLRESEERFSKAFYGSPTAMIISEKESGRLVEVNESWLKSCGFQREEVIGRTMAELGVVPSKEWRDQKLKKALRGELHLKEVPLTRKDGREIIFLTTVAPIELGGREHLLGSAVDVTELKHMERQLREREERFRSAFDKGMVPMAITGLDSCLIRVNRAFSRMLGYSEAELAGMSFYEFTHPEDMAINRPGIDAMVRGETDSFRMEKRYIRKDGRVIWVDMSTASVRDESGQPLYIITHAQDMTERKLAEDALNRYKDELEDIVRDRTFELSRIAEELRKSEEAYRLLIELNPTGVFRHLYDPVTRTVQRLHCNDAQLQALGYSSLDDYLKNTPCSHLNSDEDWNRFASKLVAEGKVANFLAQMRRTDGRLIWVLINATARNQDGKLLIEGTMTDITRHKRVEERLVLARGQLRAMASEIVIAEERSRQQFATDLHDSVVQTLGAAKLRAHIIQDRIPEEIRPEFSEIQDFVAQSITQSRLIMSEMSPPVLYELGFVPALEWLAEQIQSRNNLRITFTAGKVPLLAHEIQILLFQSTREILMNVVKHAAAGSAAVSVSSNGENVRIEIKDDGRGFDRKRAFQPDVQTGGFGLFSIRERLKYMGGRLAIRTRPGKGTCVVMTAPMSLKTEFP